MISQAKAKAAPAKASKAFNEVELEAMRAKNEEEKAARKGKNSREQGEKDLLAAIAGMKEPDRSLAERIHAIVTAAAPELMPKTWYGMPAYAKNDKVVCFFQSGQKFKTRYATFGFNEAANLDDGNMWPSAFALLKLGAAEEKRITALVKQAVS
ncbi:MAG TPA: DUF1801 domain-containing protein [Devosia sp.]|nr:DUF1801 domain-containing protein [Devosia sp.]